MILLDTNIISEMMRASPNGHVQSWLDRQLRSNLYLCAPVLSELRYGIERLTAGQRRVVFEDAYISVKHHVFRNRILDFNGQAAEMMAVLRVRRERSGGTLSIGDAQIAAIAHVNAMRLATRNTKDFQDLGLTLINPFTHEIP